jgi:uroporphyrinogen decarboxylase
MRQAGRYLPEYRKIRAEAGDFLDLCYAPELAAEVTLQPVERFAMDAAILFSDILVVPHGLGRKVAFLEGEGPSLEPMREAGEVASLSLDRMLGHLAPVYETVTRVRERLPAEVALIGFAGAPWTVATYMLEGGSSREFAAAKHWMRARTADFKALIDVLVEATVAHLSAQAAAGAEVVQIFDSWASALEGDEFERWSVEPARRIVAGLKQSHPEVPVIGFPRGAAMGEGGYLRYAKHTGINAVSIGTEVSTVWAAETLQPVCAVQGNLDPQILLAGGGAMEAEVRRILGDLSGGPHIFNLGHGIVPQTPPEHVARLAEIIRAWGAAR